MNRWRVCLHRYFKKVKGYKYKWEGEKRRYYMFRVNETKCMFSSKEILRILDCKACEVKDFEITEVSVDSRSVNKPESTLFFALKGINHDGHDYVEKIV